MLVWLLLQKIEKLEAEIQSYKEKNQKLNKISSEQLSPALLFIEIKKDMCHHHISSIT